MVIQRDNNIIDFIKGFTIFLVVLGHSIQVNYINFDEILIFKFIYSFHMPLFMLISGYLASLSFCRSICSLQKCILNKALFLLVPYFSWYIINLFFSGALNFYEIFDSLGLLLVNVDRGLWFLYILFLLYVILYISSKFKYKYFILLLFILFIPMSKILGMYLLKWYLIFFVLGMLLFDFQNNKVFLSLKKYSGNNITKFFISILFLCSLYFWERTFTPNSYFSNVYYLFMYKFIVAILGMYFFYYFCIFIHKNRFISNILNLFGKHSLRIYILNFIILAFLKELYLIHNYFLLFIVSILICFFSVYLVDILTKFYFFKIIFGEIRHINFIKNK